MEQKSIWKIMCGGSIKEKHDGKISLQWNETEKR